MKPTVVVWTFLIAIGPAVVARPEGHDPASAIDGKADPKLISTPATAQSNAERLQAGLTPLPPKRLFHATPTRRQGSVASPGTKTGTIHARVPGYVSEFVLETWQDSKNCYDALSYGSSSNGLQVQITYTPGVLANVNIKIVGSDKFLGAAAPSAADTLGPGLSNNACFAPVPDTSSKARNNLPLKLASNDPNAFNSVESAIWGLTDTTTLTLVPIWINPPGALIPFARDIVFNITPVKLSITGDVGAYQAQYPARYEYSGLASTFRFVPN